MATRRRKRHSPEQIVRKLRDADAMFNAGKSEAEVCQALEISEHTLGRWRTQYGGMKADEAKRWESAFDHTTSGTQLKWLSIVDEYTRECLALKVARSITAEDVIDTLAEMFCDAGRAGSSP